jgi:hypothetical protein
MRRRLIFFAPLAIIGFTLFIGLGGFIVQQLWNWLLPALFGWREVTFWQALGLLALCRILFGGLRLGGSSGANGHGRLRDRCASMTPEERERFRLGLRARWGARAQTGETKAE